jgi:hypothetical protein
MTCLSHPKAGDLPLPLWNFGLDAEIANLTAAILSRMRGGFFMRSRFAQMQSQRALHQMPA